MLCNIVSQLADDLVPILCHALPTQAPFRTQMAPFSLRFYAFLRLRVDMGNFQSNGQALCS